MGALFRSLPLCSRFFMLLLIGIASCQYVCTDKNCAYSSMVDSRLTFDIATNQVAALAVSPAAPSQQVTVTSNDAVQYILCSNSAAVYSQNIVYTMDSWYANMSAPLILQISALISNTTNAYFEYELALALDFLQPSGSYTVNYVLAAAGPLETIALALNPIVDSAHLFLLDPLGGRFVNTLPPRALSTTFNISKLILQSVIYSYIGPNDRLQKVRVTGKLASGCGAVSISHQLLQPLSKFGVNGTTPTCLIMLPGLTTPTAFKFQLSIIVPVPAPAQYMNATTTIPCNIINQTFLDYSRTLSTYKGKFVWQVGYINNTWLTPAGAYSLPIYSSASPSMQLLLNFAYVHSSMVAGQMAVCSVLVLRNDWDGTRFISPATTPVRQIYVCSENTVVSKGTFISSSVIFSGMTFSEYRSTGSVSGASWPVHIFVNLFNQTTWFIDLFDVFKRTATAYSFPANEVIASVEFGIRVHNGAGRWMPQQVMLNAYGSGMSTLPVFPAPASLPIVPSPTVPPTPNYSGLPEIAIITAKILTRMAETPNLMMIVKSIKPLFFTIEEYGYYFLLTDKNPSVSVFYQFCFNTTWRRWEPDYITTFEALHTPRFGFFGQNDYAKTPDTLKEQGETIVFLPNTEHYWRTYIPLTVITHLLLMLLWRAIPNYPKIRKWLKSFSLFTPLLWTLCCQNAQYLSFRSFAQLLAPVAQTPGTQINLVFSLVVLFGTVVLAISTPFILKRTTCAILFDCIYPTGGQFLIYVSTAVIVKILTGFCHAYLHYDQLLQLSVMLTIEVGFTCLILYLRTSFKAKSVWLCITLKSISRVLLNTTIILELCVDHTTEECEIFAMIELFFIGTVFTTSILQFIARLSGCTSAKAQIPPSKLKSVLPAPTANSSVVPLRNKPIQSTLLTIEHHESFQEDAAKFDRSAVKTEPAFEPQNENELEDIGTQGVEAAQALEQKAVAQSVEQRAIIIIRKEKRTAERRNQLMKLKVLQSRLTS